MSRMSELHDDLSTIHAILLGQRGVAQDAIIMLEDSHKTVLMSCVESLKTRVACINDLLLEFEAAGVVWPDNVVELPLCHCRCSGKVKPCDCGDD